MVLKNKKGILVIILAAFVAGGIYLCNTLGRTYAFVVTSRFSADYCTAFLAVQDDVAVFAAENTDKPEMWDEINRLGVTDLYVISDSDKCLEIPNHAKPSLKVHHIDPLDGVSSSVQIAGLARKKSDTVFIVDENTEVEVMAGLCSASAYAGIPILFSDAQTLSPAAVQYIKEGKITKVYLIGETLDAGIASKLEQLGMQVETIRETNAAYINGAVNHVFVNDANNLVVAFRAEEILSAANMGVMDDGAILFVPEAIADSQELYVTLRSFGNITSLTEERPEIMKQIEMISGRALERPFRLKDTGCDGAVFYIPHQDDETLFFSQVMMEAIHEFGAENVYAVLVSDGAASSAQRKEPIVGYLNDILDGVSAILEKQDIVLSDSDRNAAAGMLFFNARTNEYLAALKQMGVTNVEIYQFPDGGLKEYIPQIKEIISSYEADESKGNLIHFTYSPYYETHNDHKAVGQALYELYGSNSGCVQNIKFIVKNEEQFDVEFMNEPNDYYDTYTLFLADQSGSAQIRAASKEYELIQCDSEMIAQDIANLVSTEGCTITEAVAQSEAVKQLRLGVGIVSVRTSFQYLNMRTEHGTRITTLHEAFSRGE